jgi:hypothetical protein
MSVSRLTAAIAAAERALATTGDADFAALADELDAARHGVWDDELQMRAVKLWLLVQERRKQAALDHLARSLPPCPCCRGRDLAVAEHCTFGDLRGVDNHTLHFTLVVCTACGDTRLRCENATELVTEAGFRAVTVPSPPSDGPFR